ncbi:MAG: class I SAM-dependent methyltransferase [Rhodospirillaceae bacterium]
MGLFEGHAEYVARRCLDRRIRGRVLTLGRIDVFLTLPRFIGLMERLGLAEGVDGVPVFKDTDIARAVDALITGGGHLRTFCNPGIQAEPIVSDRLFFTALGFETVDAVDIGDHEGANLIFDLNADDIRSHIPDEYDLVLDCGTMEHVFDVARVFRHLFEVTRIGGHIIHVMPGNNFYDHGFYQLSPTLFRDYYFHNKFDLVDVSVMEYHSNTYAAPSDPLVERWDRYRSWRYDMDLMAPTSFGQLTNALYYTLACVRKVACSSCGKAPMQAMFVRHASVSSKIQELAGCGPVFIFGTARGAELLYNEIMRCPDVQLAGFIDLERTGTLFDLPVLRFDDFAATMPADTAVVLSNQYVRQNSARLNREGFTRIFDAHSLVMALNRQAEERRAGGTR